MTLTPIEIVPLRGATLDTNVDQVQPQKAFDSGTLPPRLASPFQPQPNPAINQLPLPQTVSPSQRERDLIDRRKNWVFMTPEDYAFSDRDSKSGKTDDKDDGEKTPTTAMERYYKHLYDSDHAAATNQFSKTDSTRWNMETNSSTSDLRTETGIGFAVSPFDTVSSDAEALRATRRSVFSDVFASDTDASLPSPEKVRAQAEQKSHLDSFKELWNIDQPPAPAAPTSTSGSTPTVASSTSIFGTPQGTPLTFNAFSSTASKPSSSQEQTPIVQPTITTLRNSGPPRPTFAPPQREF